MKIRAYNTMKLENYTEYETDKIIGIGIDADEEDKEFIRNGATPMLNFRTTDGGHMGVPIEFLIDIR